MGREIEYFSSDVLGSGFGLNVSVPNDDFGVYSLILTPSYKKMPVLTSLKSTTGSGNHWEITE
jgi:hypothetical protein